MAELRFHPLTRDWVMVASHRQGRPQMPENWCPFCPGSGRVPQNFTVLKYDNDFPALSPQPPEPDDVATDFYQTAPAYGKCEVILYSSGHRVTLPELSDTHMAELVELWCQRFTELSKDPSVQYVYIFENRGEAVGVTMPHPHGQIYAYPFLPKKLVLETESQKQYRQEKQGCIFCKILEEEKTDGRRVIFENQQFTVFLPFFTEYPYGVYIFPKNHIRYITDLDSDGRRLLGVTLRDTVAMLDALFDFPFPYMMCMHNAPVNQKEEPDFHFHIEFFPPMRSGDKIKYNASSETGAWAHCNPTAPEEKAQELRQAYQRAVTRG